MRKVSGKEIDDVIKEATKLLKDNPHLKIYQAVALAKETMKHRKKAPTKRGEKNNLLTLYHRKIMKRR